MSIKSKKNKEPKLDSFASAVAGVGAGNAKSLTVGVKNDTLQHQWQILDILYETDWLIGKIIDLPADAMTNQWIRIQSDSLTPEDIESFEDFIDETGLKDKVNEAIKWADLYGGSCIIIVTKDGKEASEPLDYANPGELIAFNVLDSSQISPSQYNLDALTKGFGEPTHYRMTTEHNNAEIHHSRVIKFTGIDLPYKAKMRHNWWGASRITRLQDLIKTTQMTIGAVGELIFESKFDVIKIPGLSNMLMSKSSDKLISLYENINLQKSITNSILLDSEMDISSTTYQFAGIRDIIQEMMVTVAGASAIPEAILVGRNMGGLNSSNKEVYKEWSKSINDRQNRLKKQFTALITVSAFQVGITDFDIEFVSLYSEDEGEKAIRINMQSQTDVTYINAGVITADEVRTELKQNGDYDNLNDELADEDFIGDLNGNPNDNTNNNGTSEKVGTEDDKSIPANDKGNSKTTL